MPFSHETSVVNCVDLRALEVSIYRPEAFTDGTTAVINRGAIIINAATGVKRSFYDAIAQYFAMGGWTVVTWDARGIGHSRMGSAAKDSTRMRDWGEKDLEAVLQWVSTTIEPNWSRLTVAGHSSGGHLALLAPSMQRVPRLVLLASGTCYWRRYPLSQQPRILFAWWVLVPLMLLIKGYWPGRIGVGHDLPKGVALDWQKWSLMREYLFDDASVDSSGYRRYQGRVLSLAFTDDVGFAPPVAVNHLLSKLCSAHIDQQTLAPSDVGLKRIGHFGFFRKESDHLWQQVTNWIAKSSV